MHIIAYKHLLQLQLTKIKTFIGLTKLGAALCNEEKEEAKNKLAAAISRHSFEEDTE